MVDSWPSCPDVRGPWMRGGARRRGIVGSATSLFRRVPILRRGTRASGCGGRAINHRRRDIDSSQMRRAVHTLLLTAFLLALTAPVALAHDGGEGLYGETNDKVVTN